MQILVFTYIHSCKYRSWPRNFIQLSNLPLTSTVFYYIWTKPLSGFAFELYPPFDFKWDCCIIKTPKSCQFVQTRFQIFLIFSFSNTESNTAKHFITILLCSHFDQKIFIKAISHGCCHLPYARCIISSVQLVIQTLKNEFITWNWVLINPPEDIPKT